MSEHTSIEWTDATWNPFMGCTKVSAGCDNCYMFREQRQYGHDPELVRRSLTKFNDPLKWKDPRRIFTCSWSDWYHKDADPWRDEAWDIIRRTPQHTYQILTKRPGRILRHLPADWGDGWKHVWHGTSIENQSVTYRAEQLAAIPSQTYFISAEPLLGPFALSDALWRKYQWLIIGGESGPNYRVMDPRWARALRDQAQRNGVSVFLKQLGGPAQDKRGGEQALLDGQRYVEFPVAIA